MLIELGSKVYLDNATFCSYLIYLMNVSLFKQLKLHELFKFMGMNMIAEQFHKLIKIHQFYKKNIIENKNFKIINFKINKGELPLWTDVWCNNRNQLFKFLEKNDVICRYYWKLSRKERLH